MTVRVLTSPGSAGVAILELDHGSAPQLLTALELAPPGVGEVRLCRPRADGEVLDEALLVGTTSETCELHLHGSPPLLRRVLSLLGADGGGEGTSEGAATLEQLAMELAPHASTTLGARLLLAQTEGALRAALEALDVPLAEALLEAWSWQRWFLSEPRILLAGPVNAGKSTLLNLLVGEERALTSDEPGTTRDALSAPGVLGSIRIQWIDSAGERSSAAGSVERSGQELARRLRAEVDLVVELDPTLSRAQFPSPGIVRLPARGDLDPREGALQPIEDPGGTLAVVEGAVCRALGLPDRGWAHGPALFHPCMEGFLRAWLARPTRDALAPLLSGTPWRD